MEENFNSKKVLLFAFLVPLLLISVAGYPRTRSSKKSTRTVGAGDNGLSREDGLDHCQANVPCGWALYHNSMRALRPIYEYTPNTSCRCSSSETCVFTRNRLEMSLYVFHCKPKEQSRHLYKFPYNNK